MPVYEYQCPQCGHNHEEYQKMSADRTYPCPKCGGVSERQVSRPHLDIIEFHTPIEMQSIGCTSVEQIREMQRAGVPISDDPRDENYGIPIARNRKEKRKALQVAGYIETN